MSFLCFSLALISCKETAKETDAEVETEAEAQVEHAADHADMAMAAEYQCPMDCEEGKTYDKEGTCPVCKMDLKKVEKEDESASEDSESTEEGHDSH